MTAKTIFAAVLAVLLSGASVWAQSITPVREWVPNIDRAAAAAKMHAKALAGHIEIPLAADQQH